MKNKFKLVGIILIVVLITIVTFGVAEKNNLFGMKKWGTKEYYVQVKENGEEYVTKNTKGEESIRYSYKMNAFNKDGKQIKVKFHSSKNLKLDAYLLVLAFSQDKNDYNQILSYEEVPADKVPSKAKEQLDK